MTGTDTSRSLKVRIVSGEFTCGIFACIPTFQTVEILSHTSIDFLAIEAEHAAKGEGHLALAVTIDELALDLGVGAVAQHALDHCRHLRRRTAFQLGMDAGCLALDMPVNHDTAAAVAHVPLGHQVLVPGAKLLRVRRA